MQTTLDAGAWDVMVRSVAQYPRIVFANPLTVHVPGVLVICGYILAQPNS